MPTKPRFYAIPKKSGGIDVYLKYTYSRRAPRLEFFTGWSLEKSAQWSTDTQRAVTNRTAHPSARDINRDLDLLSSAAIDYVRLAAQQKSTINPDAFKAVLAAAIGKETKLSHLVSPTDYIANFVANREKSERYAKGSVQVYRTTRKHFDAFIAAKRIYATWAMFDATFFAAFTDWLYEKKFKDNHVNKITSTLMTILREAEFQNISPDLKIKKGYVTAPKVVPDKIYLTEPEIEKIRRAELPPHLDSTRKLFLIGCYTGLRFSDFSRLSADNIKTVTKGHETKHYIQIITQKTKQKVMIPLRVAAIELLGTDFQFPASKSNQKFNDDLKEIGKLAGLTDNVIYVTTHRGKRATEAAKKHELITTHTARRSFATNAYVSGIPAKFIMSVTGHATEKEFLRYLKIQATEHALLLAQHQFFA